MIVRVYCEVFECVVCVFELGCSVVVDVLFCMCFSCLFLRCFVLE